MRFNNRCGRRPVAFFPQPALEELFAVTEVGDMAVDKRKALQPVLDSNGHIANLRDRRRFF